MLVPVVIVVLAVIVIGALLYRSVPATGPGLRLGGRSRRPRRDVDVGERSRRPRRRATEHDLLAEGEEIQRRVEDRLTAQGIAPHRLAGPNPSILGDHPAAPPLPPDRFGRQAPIDRVPGTGLPESTYGEPEPVVPVGRPGRPWASRGRRR